MVKSHVVSKAILSVLLVWPLLSAQAQDCDHSPDQRAWNICTANQAEISDQRLRRLLAEVSSNADSGRRVQLARVQQRWTVFRDSECEWQTDAFAGGTIQPVVYSQCVIALTEERIAHLKLQLCEGGGMRGPCDASRQYDLPPRKERARQ